MKFINQKESHFLVNTLIIIISGFIIKALGLLNRILITRMMGPDNINLYILSFPTIMLFISFSSMSLNVTINKLVSESLSTKKYSPKILLQKAIQLSLIVAIITMIIFAFTISFIVNHLLKNPELLFPLMSTIFLIPLVGISDTLKGYFNAIKKVKFTALSNLVEQIVRIITSICFLLIFISKGTTIATFFCLLALSFGELASIIYSILKIRKLQLPHYKQTSGETKAILEMAIPTTFSHLIGNFTYFLEPIIYVFILSKLHYASKDIENAYTITNAYSLSLLTIGSFVSIALATTIVPQISESYALNDIIKLHYYLKKTFLLSLIPGIIISIILYFYGSEYMLLIYGTTKGANEVTNYVFFFLPYYLQAPLASIFQAMGKTKKLFFISTILDIVRLFLIVILSFFPEIKFQSLIIATFITLDVYFLIIFFDVLKLSHVKLSFNKLISLIFLFIFTFSFTCLLKHFQLNFIFSSFLVCLLYLILLYFLNLFDNSSLKD